MESFDACFVCLGDSNVLGSLQITSLLKELGAKKVFSKADDDVQAKFLLRNGADHVIYPEREAAIRLAVSESSDSIFDCIPLTSDHSIYELEPMDRWVGKSLKELNFRVKYHLTVIAVKRGEVIVWRLPRTLLSPRQTKQASKLSTLKERRTSSLVQSPTLALTTRGRTSSRVSPFWSTAMTSHFCSTRARQRWWPKEPMPTIRNDFIVDTSLFSAADARRIVLFAPLPLPGRCFFA